MKWSFRLINLPSCNNSLSFFSAPSSNTASFSPPFACLEILCKRLSTEAKSARASSVLMVSMSEIGSTLPSTWIVFSSSKHLTTWIIASTSLMLCKNWFPKPSPLLAPLTSPAISTNSITVGIISFALHKSDKICNLSSGTTTTPTFGSIVQNG